MISLIHMNRATIDIEPPPLPLFRCLSHQNSTISKPSVQASSFVCSPVNRIQLILKGKNVLQKKKKRP